MASSDIIKIGFDYRSSLEQFEKDTNGVFDGISNKAGKQKITIQLDAKDDKIIEKIKELQKLKLDKFTFEFGNSGLKEQLQTFDKLENKINEIINLGKGKSFIDSSSTVADIGKIVQNTNNQAKAIDKVTNSYKNQAYELASVLKMLAKLDQYGDVPYAEAFSKAVKSGAKSYKNGDDIQFAAKKYGMDEESIKYLRGLSVNLSNAFNYTDTLGLDTANITNVEKLTEYFRELLKEKLEFNNTKLNTSDIEELIKALGIAKKELFDDGTKSGRNIYGDGTLDKYSDLPQIIQYLKQQETQAIATAEAEQKLAEAQKETASNTSNSNNSQIEELKSDIQEVKTELGDVKDRISSIESNGFENVREDVEKTKESVKELNSELTEMKSNLSSTPQESNISLTSDSTVEQQIKSESELNSEIEKRENIIRELQQLQEKLTVHEDFHGNDRYFADQLPTEEEIREADKRIKQLTGTNNIFNIDKLIQDRNKWLSEVKYSLEEYDDLIKANDQKALDEYTTRGLSRIGGAESFFGYEDNNFSIASKFVEEKEKIQNEINDLYTDLDKLDEKMNLDSNNSSVDNTVQSQEKLQSELKETQKQAEKTAQAVKESTTASTGQKKDAFHSDIDTSSSVKSLENLEEEIKKIFTDANELQNILDSLHNGKYFHLSWTTDGIDETGADERVRQLSKLLKEYGYTINNFKSDSDAFDTSGVINAIKEENNILEQNTQKVKKNTQAKEQNANVNFNKYDKRLDSYNGKIDKYKTTINRFNDGGWTSSTYLENVQAVKNAVKEYEDLLKELKGKDASLVTSEDINKLDDYEKKIKDTIATVTNMSASEKGYNFVSGQKELDKIHKLLNENSKMSSEAKAKIQAYYREIESGNPSMSLDKIHGEIMKIYNAEVEAGRAGRTLWDTMKNSGFHQIAAQMAGMFGVYDVINLGKQAFSTVKELDYALVDLKKTTAMNSSELEQFYYDSNDVAKQMGVTTKEIIDQASSWSRLGYNSKQAATEMAKLSSQFALISPGMDTTTSQEGLVSIMKAWDIGYQDVKSQIMDDINALGNAMAEDNQDIVEGMERSAAALAAVGTSTKDAFALFSGIQEVLQNSEKSGTSLRSVALRLRSFDETTGEYSEDLANITGELADLTKTAEHAQGVSVFKPGSTTEFKSLVDYFREIADIWDEMSQKQQNDFLLKAFGRTQAQAGAALIQNFKGVEKALDVMDNAAGSADKEMETAKQSITYKLNELKQTWVGTVQDIANRDDLGKIVDGLIDLSSAIGFVIDKLGLVGTVGLFGGAGTGIFKFIKNFDWVFKPYTKTLSNSF